MKKILILAVVALLGISQQIKAANVVNNTSCGISVEVVFYNALTCGITSVCTVINVPGHTTVTIPPCISSTSVLPGYTICWSPSVCSNCVSIGGATGPYPCPQYPAGPVALSTECSECFPGAVIPIRWVGDNLVVG